jgi:manganese-transporting P-type ATPase
VNELIVFLTNSTIVPDYKMTKDGKLQPRIDDLIQRVSYHTSNPTIFFVLPFIILIVTWIYLWIFVYGFDEYHEAGFIGLVVISVLQVLVCLCCFWSVHVRAFLNCRKVSLKLLHLYF